MKITYFRSFRLPSTGFISWSPFNKKVYGTHWQCRVCPPPPLFPPLYPNLNPVIDLLSSACQHYLPFFVSCSNLAVLNIFGLSVEKCRPMTNRQKHHTINRTAFVCLFVPLLLRGLLMDLRQTWWVYVGGARNWPWGVLFWKGQRVNGSKVTFSEQVTRRYIIW